jgi:phage RecT family recombinase
MAELIRTTPSSAARCAAGLSEVSVLWTNDRASSCAPGSTSCCPAFVVDLKTFGGDAKRPHDQAAVPGPGRPAHMDVQRFLYFQARQAMAELIAAGKPVRRQRPERRMDRQGRRGRGLALVLDLLPAPRRRAPATRRSSSRSCARTSTPRFESGRQKCRGRPRRTTGPSSTGSASRCRGRSSSPPKSPPTTSFPPWLNDVAEPVTFPEEEERRMNAVKPKSTAVATIEPAPWHRRRRPQDGEAVRLALPEHVSPERFVRVVITAIKSNPDLKKADRESVLGAAMKCAQDGLLPDGKEAALVTYGTKAQYLPMIAGVLTKVRRSGELRPSTPTSSTRRTPSPTRWATTRRSSTSRCMDGPRGKPIAVYAIAKTKDGGIYREVMSIEQVNQVRNVSRAKNNGPWVQWWDEMARKTVLRRLSKRLPMSTDLQQVFQRDDDHYDLIGPGRAGHAPAPGPAGRLRDGPYPAEASRPRDRRGHAGLDPRAPRDGNLPHRQVPRQAVGRRRGWVPLVDARPANDGI